MCAYYILHTHTDSWIFVLLDAAAGNKEAEQDREPHKKDTHQVHVHPNEVGHLVLVVLPLPFPIPVLHTSPCEEATMVQ